MELSIRIVGKIVSNLNFTICFLDYLNWYSDDESRIQIVPEEQLFQNWVGTVLEGQYCDHNKN